MTYWGLLSSFSLPKEKLGSQESDSFVRVGGGGAEESSEEEPKGSHFPVEHPERENAKMPVKKKHHATRHRILPLKEICIFYDISLK